MYLEISDNNGRKYIRVCESNRIFDQVKKKYISKKTTIKNIGPVSKFDDGKPNFIDRLKSSFQAGKPILDELKPYTKSLPQEIYTVRLAEGTDDCVADPKLIANSLLEGILEDLDISQLVRSYKNIYGVSYDVYGLFKLLLFGRILSPASKWSTMRQLNDYYTPIVKGDINEYDIYRALDFIYEHRNAIFSRIDKTMVSKYGRATDHVFYDVTNFFCETDEADSDLITEDGHTEPGLRKRGVSKENKKQPIVQMGLIMDKNGIPISTEVFPGNTLDHLTMAETFRNSVPSLQMKSRYVFVSDKGIGKGTAVNYAILNGNGYLTSRTVRGSSKEEKAWILKDEGYTQKSDNFKYKTRIVKRITKADDGSKIEYAEKVLTYWSRRYFEREKKEKQSFYEFAQKLLENPSGFKFGKTVPADIRKYLKKKVVNTKTGEILNTADLNTIIDLESLKRDYDLIGYYTLATSEINMPDEEMIQLYSNLVEIEDQFRIMKSTLETRPMFVRTKEHIVAHLTVCTVALILLRMIQRQIKKTQSVSDCNLFSCGLSADRIQVALNKWTVEKIGDVYYRFGGINDPDLSLILKSFGIEIPKKCYKLGELRALKGNIKMSM